jgi:predicted nucleic acid-binding protein
MLDATVLIAGIGWPRWSYEVLRHAARGDFQLVLSPLVIEQARRHLATIAPGRVSEFEEWLQACSAEIEPDPAPKSVAANLQLVRQANDVPVALAAIAAHVDYFVTEDKDFTETAADNPSLHRQLKIMRPVIFLREVMGWSRDALEQARRRNWADI